MKRPATNRHFLSRVGNALLGVWLLLVLFAYAGVVELPGILADLALLTVLTVIATMIWKYAFRPLFP